MGFVVFERGYIKPVQYDRCNAKICQELDFEKRRGFVLLVIWNAWMYILLRIGKKVQVGYEYEECWPS